MIFQKKAARRATSTKLTFVYQKKTIFQKKGRPQGNIDKTDLRLLKKNNDFSKKRPPAKQTSTKLTFVY